MYEVSFTFDEDVILAVQDTAKKARPRLRTNLEKVREGPVIRSILVSLSTEPNPPDRPVRWTNERQRRAVMRKLRLMGMNFYVRTHRLARGWGIVLLNLLESTGVFGIINKTPYTDYVQGENQQRYLYKWPLARRVIRDSQEEVQELVTDAWIDAVIVKKIK